MANQCPRTTFLFVQLILVVLLIPMSCIRPDAEKTLAESGTVHYKITYPDEIADQSFSFLLPGEMDFFFGSDHTRASFKGSMGMYALDFISDHLNDSSITLLRVLDSKMYVPSSESNSLFIFNNFQKGEVVLHKDSTRLIQGYVSHLATISNPLGKPDKINIWYTRQLRMKETNKNTPFAKIPGVMLVFELSYSNILFKLEAESVDPTPPPPGTFQVPPNYKVTSIEEVEAMVTNILN